MIQTPPQSEKRKKYFGERVARVIDTEDPEGLLKVKVRVLGVMDDALEENLPWAEYKLPVGARLNEGFFTPVQPLDYVWVDFPYDGDTRRPRITGGVHFAPEEAPNLPHEAWEGSDAISHKRTGDEGEPAASEYHTDAEYSQFGILIEIVKGEDADTGSFRLTHKGTGTAIEITPAGNITIHSEGSVNLSATDDFNAIVGGDVNIEAGGDANVEAGGDANIDAGGMVNVKGSMINLN